MGISNINSMNKTSNITKSIDLGNGKLVELVVLVLIEILILFGNALVIVAFFKGPRRIRTVTNYFVVNLAISDMMVGCISVPFWFTELLGKWICY